MSVFVDPNQRPSDLLEAAEAVGAIGVSLLVRRGPGNRPVYVMRYIETEDDYQRACIGLQPLQSGDESPGDLGPVQHESRDD